MRPQVALIHQDGFFLFSCWEFYREGHGILNSISAVLFNRQPSCELSREFRLCILGLYKRGF